RQSGPQRPRGHRLPPGRDAGHRDGTPARPRRRRYAAPPRPRRGAARRRRRADRPRRLDPRPAPSPQSGRRSPAHPGSDRAAAGV
ncbi:MAG: hypothetical protein AVDCRST_MAG73-2762, partial [uncultured Thermomicrobiales bacterium]